MSVAMAIHKISAEATHCASHTKYAIGKARKYLEQLRMFGKVINCHYHRALEFIHNNKQFDFIPPDKRGWTDFGEI